MGYFDCIGNSQTEFLYFENSERKRVCIYILPLTHKKLLVSKNLPQENTR